MINFNLKSKAFTLIKEKVKYITDRCPTCKKPRKRVLSGVEVITKPEDINGNPKNQLPLIDTLSPTESRVVSHIKNKSGILLNVSETEMILGEEMRYKIVKRGYKLFDIEGLRKITVRNKKQYRKDKKKWERNEKEGNGYG